MLRKVVYTKQSLSMAKDLCKWLIDRNAFMSKISRQLEMKTQYNGYVTKIMEKTRVLSQVMFDETNSINKKYSSQWWPRRANKLERPSRQRTHDSATLTIRCSKKKELTTRFYVNPRHESQIFFGKLCQGFTTNHAVEPKGMEPAMLEKEANTSAALFQPLKIQI